MKKEASLDVLIVDPDKYVRTLIGDALSHARFNIIKSVANSTEALDFFKPKCVQVAILELDLGDLVDGYSLAHSLRKIDPNVGIVFLTNSQDSRFVSVIGSTRVTGSRYLAKKDIESIPQLISIIAQTIHRPFYENVNQENVFSEITNLQVEIWKEAAHGDSTSKIATHHGVSEKAVESTLARIYHILGIKKNKAINPRVLLSEAFRKYQGKI